MATTFTPRPFVRTHQDDSQFIRLIVAFAIISCTLTLFISGEDGRGAGLEMSAIAAHLVNGYGFLSPYIDPSYRMETTVCAPLYVWIIAGFYRIAGIESYTARLLLQLFNILLHCATLVLLFDYCRKTLSTHAAKWFAILFCLHPHLLYLPSNIWETSLTTFFLALILHIATFKLSALGAKSLFMFGILLGFTSLSNPAWTIVYPLICLIPYLQTTPRTSIAIITRSIVIILAGFALVVTPWIARNYTIDNTFIFIRGMTAPELFKGNNRDANGGHGTGFVKYYLLSSEDERTRLAELGEKKYNEFTFNMAVDFIRENPACYVQLTLQRIGMWWSGDIDAFIWYKKTSTQRGQIEQKKGHYHLLAGVLIITGFLTTLLSFWGILKMGRSNTKIWCALIYIFILPIPFFLMIIGFRYQAALMPFLLIPAGFAINRILTGPPVRFQASTQATSPLLLPVK